MQQLIYCVRLSISVSEWSERADSQVEIYIALYTLQKCIYTYGGTYMSVSCKVVPCKCIMHVHAPIIFEI